MTGTRGVVVLSMAVLLGSSLIRADLTPARAETNPEKRADKALVNAQAMVHEAEKFFRAGESTRTKEALEELRQSVELAYASLRESGKNPRRSPKYFKRAEIKTRDILRSLKDFQLRMSVDEREWVDPVRNYVRQVHDDILAGILGTEDWKKK